MNAVGCELRTGICFRARPALAQVLGGARAACELVETQNQWASRDALEANKGWTMVKVKDLRAHADTKLEK